MSQETFHSSISLSQLLAEAGVRPVSNIRVTGPGSLSALLWLCRRGYERVGCLQAGRRSPADDAEALLVAHTATSSPPSHSRSSVARRSRTGSSSSVRTIR